MRMRMRARRVAFAKRVQRPAELYFAFSTYYGTSGAVAANGRSAPMSRRVWADYSMRRGRGQDGYAMLMFGGVMD